MRLLLLYPELKENDRRSSVLYIRRLAINMEARGHVLYGRRRENFIEGESVRDAIKRLGPFDGVLTLEPKFVFKWLVDQLKDISDIKKAVLLSDCYPYKDQLRITIRHLFYSNYDLVFYQTVAEGKFLMRSGRKEKMLYLPMSVDLDYFAGEEVERDIDVAATWSWTNSEVYPMRGPTLRKLKKIRGIKLHTEHVFLKEYVNLLHRSKIFVAAGTIYENSQSRAAEVPACRCLMMTNSTLDLRPQGWKHGRNVVVYTNLNDMVSKIRYYLEHEEERKAIAENGYKHVVQNLSNNVTIKKIEEAFESVAPRVQRVNG